MEKRLKTNQLFVSGVPQDCTEEEIKEYFSWFGNIDRVKLWKTGYSRSRSFLVTPENEEVYLKILTATSHLFRNRFLHCKPFEAQKMNLKNQLMDVNLRRVLLKRVPSQIPEWNIRALIENFAGKIETMFAYRPETSDQDYSHTLRKHRTYSVLFTTKAAAERLLQLGYMTLDDQSSPRIKIEKYCFRGRRGQMPIEKRLSPPSVKNQSENLTTRDQIPSINRLSRSPAHGKAVIEGRPSHRPGKSPSINKYERVDINANLHCVKPTSKKYFATNKKFFTRSESGIQIRLLPKGSLRYPWPPT